MSYFLLYQRNDETGYIYIIIKVCLIIVLLYQFLALQKQVVHKQIDPEDAESAVISIGGISELAYHHPLKELTLSIVELT